MANKNSEFLLKGLNEQQCDVVSAPLQNMLIVAGAGTGKTRVLVSRIAWLLKVENIPARSIMAVTFTNKAAAEMESRINMLVGNEGLHSIWCSTFHSMCLRILRAYSSRANLPNNFSILDGEGQKLLVKRIEVEMDIDVKEYKPAQIVGIISKLKERGLRASDFVKKHDGSSALQRVIARVYPAYEQSCNKEGLVDFSELLLRVKELLQNNQDLRELQHRRFKEILVDEFQDTSSLQYELLKLIAGPDTHILVVGDDDQSIYGWRGAEITNMKHFSEEFKDVKVYALMRNYRSRQNILDVANAIISKNDERMVNKSLEGVKGSGSPVQIINCVSGYYESYNVVKLIADLIDDGVNARDIAVLYRNNSLSAPIEAELSTRGISYAVYGGLKFFDRAEVQDALAYLRVLLNEADDTALLRIINVPSRKIGPKVVESLRKIATDRQCSIMQAVRLIRQYGEEKGAPKELSSLAKKLRAFSTLYEELTEYRRSAETLAEFIKEVINKSGLYEMYRLKDEKEERGKYDNQRHLNLEQLVSNAVTFEERALNRESDLDDYLDLPVDSADALQESDRLLDFLSTVSLAAGTEITGNGSDESVPNAVNLMTIHSAKGLEFKYVFLIAFENGTLPSARSERDGNISEERRLAYVGVTRAIEKLYISYAKERLMYGQMEYAGPSVFLRELVNEYQGRSADERPFEICR